MTKTALVVDDSKSARFALRKYLESHAFKVDTAENAQEAYNFLKQNQPDLIFLDHVMPGTDGFEALRHIKSDPATLSIPVVICSSNEGDDFVNEARSKGAADVLQKPPSSEQLGRILDNLARMSANLKSMAPPRAPEAPRPVPPAAPSKVSSIREPDIAIEQAVMKALRSSMPQQPAAPPPSPPPFNPLTTAGFMASAQVPPSPPPPAAAPPPVFNPSSTGVFHVQPGGTGSGGTMGKSDQLATQHLRDQIEARMKKMTQDLFMQIAELKANIAHLESHERAPEQDQLVIQEATQSAIDAVQPHIGNLQNSISSLQPQISSLHSAVGSMQPQLSGLQATLGNMQARIELLERNVEAHLSELRGQLEAALHLQSDRINQITQQARQAAAEEAHAAAERTVMSAASRISDQFADSILKAFGRR